MMARGGTEARRSRGAGGPAERPAPPVRDLLRGGRTWRVEFLTRRSLDFIISLTLGEGTQSELLPEDRAWLIDARATLSPERLADLDESFGPTSPGLFHGLASVVVEREDLDDPRALVQATEGMSAHDAALVVLADVLPGADGRAVTQQALAGDAVAMARVMDGLSSAVGAGKGEDIAAFLRDPGPAWERAQRALAAWLPHFEAIGERVARLQAADLASRAGDRDPADSTALIERVTGGVRWLPDPGVRRVFLAPSYLSRPYNYIYQGTDWRLFCYPIEDAILDAADRDTPPAAMVRLYRALGDPTRMRILRLLADRDWYLTELAAQLDLSKPTTKHHLALLRSAGLVTVTEEGNLTWYSIRHERIAQAGTLLAQYLG